MLEAIGHRGPDGSGAIYRDDLAIGARRLAIVDSVHGAQPMWSEDGRVVCVVNGEIFNHKSLRATLEAQGIHFRTTCDAELVPALYLRHGPDFVELLNGQFAIALYDFEKKVFHAWRDPLGICPFFYTTSAGSLVFASEIKGLLRYSSVRPTLDLVGLDQILTFPGPVSPRTLFKGISSLPPGARLDVRRGHEPAVKRYWDLKFEEESSHRSVESWSEELEGLLFEAVRLRRSDEFQTGLYLSGGIDSSLIGAMLRRIAGDGPLHTFSVEFEDSLISEAAHQERMRKAIGAQGHVTRLDAHGVWSRMEAAVWHTETPLRETFNIAALALSQMAREERHKVVLAGQGADELFAGYVGYRFDARAGSRQSGISSVEGLVNERLWGDPTFTYERKYGGFAETKSKLYSASARAAFLEANCTMSAVLDPAPGAGVTRLQRRSYIDCKLRLSDHLLSGHGDRMAMANGVEVRYPFLDKNVVAFASRAPDAIKLKSLKEKFVVKDVGARWIPEEIVNREKFGFTAPGSPALLALNHERVMDLLSDERIRRQNVFDVDEVRRLKDLYGTSGFRIAVPFETDLLISVITYGIFSDLFGLPDF